MAEEFNAEWAQSIIEDGVSNAQGLIDNPEQLSGLIASLEEKLAGLPDTVAPAFTNVPLMTSLVKSYLTKEYTEVSDDTIVSLVSAFVYLVKEKDLIPDDIPVVGLADDVAVATIAMGLNEQALKAYALWREQNDVGERSVLIGEEPIDVEPHLASSDQSTQ